MIGAGQNECLRIVQRDAEAVSEWFDYAAYCQYRERGMRQQAFDSLNRFIGTAKTWPLSDRKKIIFVKHCVVIPAILWPEYG